MNVADIPLLSMLKTRMTWLNQRQDLLSQNVANADTPGFVAHDLKPVDFSQILSDATPGIKGGGLTVTDPRHIAIDSAKASQFDDVTTKEIESDPNGNSISIEQEMIKVADTQAQFAAATDLYAKAMTLMKTAIGH